MHTLIVDDSLPARERLERLLNQTGISDILSTGSADTALEAAENIPFALAFLDIQMPGMDGLELAQRLLDIDPSTRIVFVTAYSEYALEAFEQGGVGYLLKPVDPDKLDTLLARLKPVPKQSTDFKALLVKSGRHIHVVKPEAIYYVQADLDEVIVRTKEVSGYVAKRFYEIESLLAPYNFFKIHRSHLVNLDKIASMESVEQSKLVITFDGIKETVTSSKEGAKKLREFFDRLG